MPTVAEKMAAELQEKRGRLAKYFEKKDADGRYEINDVQRTEIKSLNDELNVLTPKWERARDDEKAEADNRKSLDELSRPILPAGFHGGGGRHGTDGVGTDRRGNVKSFGEMFTESTGYKSFVDAKKAGSGLQPNFGAMLDGEVKTLFSTTAGWDPFVNRQPGYVLSAQQLPKIVDLIPQTNTDQHSIKWMMETVFVNNAAETAEGALYPESAFALSEQLSPVVKIAHFIPTTDEQVADVPGVRGYLDGRLELGLKQRLDRQLLVGNGTTPNLRGLLNIGIGAQVLGPDSLQDAYFKAMTSIQTNAFADASAMILNPQDYQTIRLAKTSQGVYLWGNPDMVGPQRMWGLPIVTSTYMPAGTGIVGDFAMFSQLFYRQGVEILVSNSHADFFIRGQLAIRASIRVGFIVTRPAAFAKVTLV